MLIAVFHRRLFWESKKVVGVYCLGKGHCVSLREWRVKGQGDIQTWHAVGNSGYRAGIAGGN